MPNIAISRSRCAYFDRALTSYVRRLAAVTSSGDHTRDGHPECQVTVVGQLTVTTTPVAANIETSVTTLGERSRA